MCVCVCVCVCVLINDVLLWTLTYGRAKAGRPARTYIQQLCEDTGCSSEDRRRWKIGRNGERGSGISVLAARHDDDDDDIYIYIFILKDQFWCVYYLAVWSNFNLLHNSQWMTFPTQLCLDFIIIIIVIIIRVFILVITKVFHWGLSDNKSLQVFKTLQSILIDFSSTVVWEISILHLIFSSCSLFSKFLRTISMTPTTIGTTVTFMFNRFFSSLARSLYLSFHSVVR